MLMIFRSRSMATKPLTSDIVVSVAELPLQTSESATSLSPGVVSPSLARDAFGDETPREVEMAQFDRINLNSPTAVARATPPRSCLTLMTEFGGSSNPSNTAVGIKLPTFVPPQSLNILDRTTSLQFASMAVHGETNK